MGCLTGCIGLFLVVLGVLLLVGEFLGLGFAIFGALIHGFFTLISRLFRF